MSWNYRVLAETKTKPNGKKWISFSIHEVYYDDNGKPIKCTKNPINLGFYENPKDIFKDLKLIKRVKKSPILWLDDDKFLKPYKKRKV